MRSWWFRVKLAFYGGFLLYRDTKGRTYPKGSQIRLVFTVK